MQTGDAASHRSVAIGMLEQAAAMAIALKTCPARTKVEHALACQGLMESAVREMVAAISAERASAPGR